MDIKNFQLKSKNNYKKVQYSSFNEENTFFDYIASLLSTGTEIIELEENKIPSKLFLSIAKKTRELCSIYQALFFIYDRVDIAFLCNADGIVLSENSLEIEHAKHILGDTFMYGFSVKNTQINSSKYDFYVFSHKIDKNSYDIPCFISQ